MTILALEFSSPQRSVAVLQPDGAAMTFEVVEAGRHGMNAFGMIEQALAGAKIGREQIDALAVGLGPGSYTGIRAAISLAQGWQLARGVKVLGVSSAEAVVAQARSEKILGRVSVAIDAQRGEFYLASYEVNRDGWQEIAPLKIMRLSEVQSGSGADGILIGPEVTRWFPTGRVIFPRAAALAELAARRRDFLPGENLEPIYLRETNFVKAPPARIAN